MKRTDVLLPNLEFALWPVERLQAYAQNARQHPGWQIDQIAASIDTLGFNNPVLAAPDGEIIAGHGRFLAALKLGLTTVPVIIIAHLSEANKRAFRIADNQLALNATWDLDMLSRELEALAEEKFDLNLLGFSEEQLRELVDEVSSGLTDEDEIPELQAEAVTRTGDVWNCGEHRVGCGDGTDPQDVGRLLEGGSCDMIFTDPPYNVDYTGKGAQKMKLANDNLGDRFDDFLGSACRSMLAVCRGAIYICMSSGELHRLKPAFCAAGGHWSTFIIWKKHLFTLGRSDYQRQYEPILYGWAEGINHYWCGSRDQGDVWEVDRPVRNDAHPTMKPVELVERAIANSSQQDSIVFDPFAGAGSTLIAATKLRRRARLIEIDPHYVDTTVRRWQQYTGEQAVLHESGVSFNEVALQRGSTEKVAGDSFS